MTATVVCYGNHSVFMLMFFFSPCIEKNNLQIPFCESRFRALGDHAHTQTHLTANKVLSSISCSV